MKLGIFDSGLGGLLITKAVREKLPKHDILYFGDTLHIPYGNRSDEAIFAYTRHSMEFMFEQGCQLIVVACNTASAAALRRLQQKWLPGAYPGRNIIGVVVPTLEAAIEQGHKKLGVIGTNYVIGSNVFADELQKISPDIKIKQQATPLLVPLVENDGMKWAQDVLHHYIDPMKSDGVECLLLGCTHYPFMKNEIRKVLGEGVSILSQDDIIPAKLVDYLKRHPEYDDAIGKSGNTEFFVSDLTDNYKKTAQVIYGQPVNIQKMEFAA